MYVTHTRRTRVDQAQALAELTDEVYRLFFRLRRLEERLHADENLPETERDVLWTLLGEGPRTVPALARARTLSRQRLQQVVDRLLERGLVERRANPAHESSYLIAISVGGRKTALQMLRREHRQFRRVPLRAGVRKIRLASEVLRGLREALPDE